VLTTLKFGQPFAATLLPGDRLAIAVGHGFNIRDARTGKILLQLEPHHGRIWSLAPSDDGRFLLSTSSDQTVRVTPVDQKEPLLSLFTVGNDWVAWTPEGYYAASPGGEHLMGWHLNKGMDSLAAFFEASSSARCSTGLT
jgi:WD40 repeat protein